MQLRWALVSLVTLGLLLPPAASAEETLEAHVATLLQAGFAFCNGAYYSRVPDLFLQQHYVIEQYHNLSIQSVEEPITDADAARGIRARRAVVITAAARRVYGKHGSPPEVSWTAWRTDPEWDPVESFVVQDKKGQITVEPYGPWLRVNKPMTRKAPNCVTLPRAK